MLLTQVLVSIVLCLLVYFWYRFRQIRTYWQRHGIPGEGLDTSMRGLGKQRSFVDIWLDTYRKFKGTGPFCGFYWGAGPAAFVLTPDLAKLVLIKDFNKFTDRGFYHNPKHDPLSGQLFMLDGHKWRSMRNKLSPAFTSGKMKMMFPTIVKIAEELTNLLADVQKQDAVIEMKDLMARFTTDVIGTCAFGVECNSLKDPNSEFRVMGRKAVTDQRLGPRTRAFINTFPNVARFLGIKTIPDHISKFYMGIVRENIEYREKNGIRRNDFFDMLLDLKNKKLLKSEDGEEVSITVGELAAQAYLFLIAGFETSSTTLSFALYELAQHEDVQQRARDEILEVMARHGDKLTYECMSEMVYLNQIISETLRLYTVLPILNRQCLEDYPVPGFPKYVIKRNMRVLIPAGAMHRDPDLYTNPDKFDPEHFSPEKVAQRDVIEFLPFGEGPRNCIGMRFGQMQARVGLACLLSNFKFIVCDKTPIPMVLNKSSFLVSSQDGIYLQVDKL
ncbi:PREDICTED: probable cytochrome P450 6a21 [Rhagoletis zephyria]|uniref:probable cytochrome P450 6a21 n=1 Tax=Rhagoletis zephyria TaxID=28612 RepID=UPI000811201C|nr:PREDICTED: probable cytochrome P450 6a21 [Rhagoletis zephyria]